MHEREKRWERDVSICRDGEKVKMMGNVRVEKVLVNKDEGEVAKRKDRDAMQIYVVYDVVRAQK